MNTFELIVIIVLFIDAIGANVVAWLGQKWYLKHFRTISRPFPPARGWATYYLLLIIFFAILLAQ